MTVAGGAPGFVKGAIAAICGIADRLRDRLRFAK